MKNFAMLITFLLLSGCVANLSTKKYVEGNAFVSEGMPAVEIQVSSGFTLSDSGGKEIGLESDTNASQSFGLKTYEAKFYNEGDRSIRLKIRTEYTTQRRWYLASTDFRKWSGVKVFIGEQIINGRQFDTAIIQELTSRDILLVKAYSATYGGQTRLTILLIKRLPKRMFDSPPYSVEANKLLADFSKMADESFRIQKFNRLAQPQQITTDNTQKPTIITPVPDKNLSKIEKKILQVKSLYDKGLITQDEYEQKRKSILDAL